MPTVNQDPAPDTQSVLDGAKALLGGEEAPEEASGTEEVVAEAPEEAQQETEFNLEPEVPEDYAELAEMPDFDAQAEEEVNTEENQAQEQEYEYEDQNVADERKKRIAAEKRTAWLEDQRVRQNEGKWKAEGIKFYPLSQPFVDAGLVKADSRRGYARECKRIHEALKPFVMEKFLKPLEESLKNHTNAVTEEAIQEKADKWGKPLTGPNTVPAEATQKSQQYGQVKRNQTLAEEFKEILFHPNS